MTSWSLTYDLRFPNGDSEARADHYAAALDQIEWADGLGFRTVQLNEHHGSPDGYLPSPMLFASAVAARTTRIRFSLMLIAPFHDPLRVAEDLAVLDLLSKGRVSVIIAGGYAAHEFAMFGRDLKDRGKAVDEMVTTLREAWAGEPFTFRGRPAQVLPRPYREGGPRLLVGGNSRPAARRAARIGDGYGGGGPSWEDYREAMQELGKPDPGARPASSGPQTVHVAQDPDEGWLKVGPHWLHETNEYARLAAVEGLELSHRHAENIDELRQRGQYAVLTPAEARKLAEERGYVNLSPLAGGIPADTAWESLRLIESEVLSTSAVG